VSVPIVELFAALGKGSPLASHIFVFVLLLRLANLEPSAVFYLSLSLFVSLSSFVKATLGTTLVSTAAATHHRRRRRRRHHQPRRLQFHHFSLQAPRGHPGEEK
jgi:hypothetical protein